MISYSFRQQKSESKSEREREQTENREQAKTRNELRVTTNGSDGLHLIKPLITSALI